jgi:anti-sigma regulatory factor (Ser/Thr protein kinase)
MTIAAVADNLRRLVRTISRFANAQGLDCERTGQLELAVEEMLVNVINYAYPETEAGEVELDYQLSDDHSIVVEIRDWGVPFNPLTYPEPDTTVAIAGREVGGLGIFLARQLVDAIQYRREHGQNILTLRVQLNS